MYPRIDIHTLNYINPPCREQRISEWVGETEREMCIHILLLQGQIIFPVQQ